MAVGGGRCRTPDVLAAGLLALAWVVEVAAAENVAKTRYTGRRSAYREKVRQQKPQLLFALPPVSTHAHREQPQPHTAAMGNAKKESVRKERQGKTGDGMGNVKVKGENFYRYVPYRYARRRSCTLNAALQATGCGRRV